MRKILFITVGGSHVPIIKTVKEYQPDFTYFICSTGSKGSDKTVDGQGNPCGDTRKCPHCHTPLGEMEKSIVEQAKVRHDQYQKILLDDPDDIDECYCKINEILSEIRVNNGDTARIILNYTGGTKSMSLALGHLGIITPGCELSLNRGPRNDLIKVTTGDIPIAVDKCNIFAQMQLNTVSESLDRFDYSGADNILAHLAKQKLEKALQNRLIYLRQLCQAFDAWDKFNHHKALELLSICSGESLAPYIVALKKITGKMRKCHGYEKVMDLILNAQRRAKQQRFDDAIARLYRGMELLVQLRLRQSKNIDTGDIRIERIPTELHAKYQDRRQKDGKIVIGLTESYELLAVKFNDDDLIDDIGKLYLEQKNKILHTLKKRNYSILAHGLEPITEGDYDEVSEMLSEFIHQALAKINIDLCQDVSQLPQGELINF